MQPAIVMLAAVGDGRYVSVVKVLAVVAVALVWARLLTWIDKDTTAAHLPRELVNAGLFLSGLAGLVLFFLLPGFLIAYGVLWGVLLLGIGVYLGVRHQQVGLADIKQDFGKWASGLFAGRKKGPKAQEGKVMLYGPRGNAIEPPDAESPQRVGYDTLQQLLAEPLKKNAERIELRAGEGAATATFSVDGYTYAAPSVDRVAAAEAITYVKQIAGMDVSDRRKPQTGSIRTVLNGRRQEIAVLTAGSTAGESLRLTVDPKKRHDRRLEQLGFDPAQLETVRSVIQANRGIVLLAAPKGQGLTSLLYGILRAHDAFLQHIQTIEHAPPEDLEGITQTKLPATANPTEELKQVEWVTSQQPDVLMVDQIDNPASARELARYASEQNRRCYLGMRTGSALEALALWRRLMGNDPQAAAPLAMVIAGRVMRRLCTACKVAYVPDPETLRKLNMNPQRVVQLFQARTQPLRDSKGNPIPCEFCHDLRFKGRFGVFEVFVIDDDVKAAIASGASSSQLRAVLRKQRSRYLQEMALLKVEEGETSVQEVLRVLREGEAEQATRRPSDAAAKG